MALTPEHTKILSTMAQAMSTQQERDRVREVADMIAPILASMQQMCDEMAAHAAHANRPKRIVRDPQTGAVIGIEPVGDETPKPSEE